MSLTEAPQRSHTRPFLQILVCASIERTGTSDLHNAHTVWRNTHVPAWSGRSRTAPVHLQPGKWRSRLRTAAMNGGEEFGQRIIRRETRRSAKRHGESSDGRSAWPDGQVWECCRCAWMQSEQNRWVLRHCMGCSAILWQMPHVASSRSSRVRGSSIMNCETCMADFRPVGRKDRGPQIDEGTKLGWPARRTCASARFERFVAQGRGWFMPFGSCKGPSSTSDACSKSGSHVLLAFCHCCFP